MTQASRSRMQQTSSLSRKILLMLFLKHANTARPIGILVHVRSSLHTKIPTTTKITPTIIATSQAWATAPRLRGLLHHHVCEGDHGHVPYLDT